MKKFLFLLSVLIAINVCLASNVRAKEVKETDVGAIYIIEKAKKGTVLGLREYFCDPETKEVVFVFYPVDTTGDKEGDLGVFFRVWGDYMEENPFMYYEEDTLLYVDRDRDGKIDETSEMSQSPCDFLPKVRR